MKAVILAGGSGERFWPLSTPKKPKQFLDIFGGRSLIRQCRDRLAGYVKTEDTFVITSAALVKATVKELAEVPRANVVGEPMRRDTGAAVALGVGLAGGDDEVIGFFPSDQMVSDVLAFQRALKAAVALAKKRDAVVTLGVKPTYPATGFGYVDPECGRFVEKPDLKKAKAYIKKGFLWNAGMFIGRAGVFRRAFADHAPGLSALSSFGTGGALNRRLAKTYSGLPRISFDFAVMEKLSAAGGVAVVPCNCGWDDVGSYSAFDLHFNHDLRGNVDIGGNRMVETDGCVVIGKSARISLLGVKNLVVVATKDGFLVADKSRVGEMKKLFQEG